MAAHSLKHLSVPKWLATPSASLLWSRLKTVTGICPTLAATVHLNKTTRTMGTSKRTTAACVLSKTRQNLPSIKDTNRPTAHLFSAVP